MRRMRLGVAYFAGALALVAVSGSAGAQQQRDPYAATLHYGTGLINIPVAWVSETVAARQSPTGMPPRPPVAPVLPSSSVRKGKPKPCAFRSRPLVSPMMADLPLV